MNATENNNKSGNSVIISRFIAKRLQTFYGNVDKNGADDSVLTYIIIQLHEASLAGISCLAISDLQTQIKQDLSVDIEINTYLQQLPKLVERIDIGKSAIGKLAREKSIIEKLDASISNLDSIEVENDFNNLELCEKPAIILLNDYLALRHNFYSESAIIEFLLAKSSENIALLPQVSQNDLTKLNIDKLDYWQKLAIIGIYSLPLVMISGGAGTGKTTILTKAIELLIITNPDIKIVVAAPTGKAVKRLKQSISNQIGLIADNAISSKINSIAVKTIHQLLGISGKTAQAYKTATNPFNYNVIIIDEVSMLSNQLFLQLTKAMLPTTKLVLLGDEKQLPAVNSSSFFNAINAYNEIFSPDFIAYANNLLLVNSSENHDYDYENIQNSCELGDKLGTKLINQRIKLKKSFRFSEDSLIYNLADAITKQNSQDFIDILQQNKLLVSQTNEYFSTILSQFPKDKSALIDYLHSSIILCVAKTGQFSTFTINQFLDKNLRIILANDSGKEHSSLNYGAKSNDWYTGRPIMIEKNDYQLDVFNGDIGYCEMIAGVAYIRFDDKFLPVELITNNYTLAYAITIHKSQGSEYDFVQLVIDDINANFLNNAMLYTAITRAKNKLKIYADISQLNAMINKTNNAKTIGDLLLENH